MRFRVRRRGPGSYELQANLHPGGRYQLLATAYRHPISPNWCWDAPKYGEPPFYLPFDPRTHATHRDTIRHVKRLALRAQAERAIEAQTEPSPHWHSPRRDALADMTDSGVFTIDELDKMEERMEIYP